MRERRLLPDMNDGNISFATRLYGSANSSHACQLSSFCNVSAFPITTNPLRARVKATLRRRESFKNPIEPDGFDLTAEKIIISF